MASATPRSSDSTPGIGCRRVDEDDDRAAELLRQLHDAQRLAVALRTRVPEVPEDLLLCVAALLMAEHGDGLAVIEGQAADDRMVVRETAVTVQLVEIREQPLDVVERPRACRVPGHEHTLPWRQRRVDLCPDLFGPLAQALDRSLTLRRARQHAERFDLFQQYADWFFEFEKIRHRLLTLPWFVARGSSLVEHVAAMGSASDERRGTNYGSVFTSTQPIQPHRAAPLQRRVFPKV